MGDRPSGTVTFLFTDIEGSTRRWEADEAAMQADLAAHDHVLRAAVEAHGGWAFKHTGDGMCVAFASPRGAVDAAVAAQRSLQLPVRMGIGTGEAHLQGDDYFGPALNRAARVMAVGHGGQILVAATTAALLADVDLWDLGEHRLRDLSGTHRLFQVRAEGLRVDFPALRTLDAVPGNLPVQLTTFVGRHDELVEVTAAVRAHRLVTLTGVGGVGKTRLAVQAAAALTPEFPDGVWLVELAAVGDPAAVPDAVASVLRLTPAAGMTLVAAIAESLAERQVLLVVDNCEHVLDAVAELVDALLARGARTRVLATSREGLRVRGEHLWAVPSLDARAGTGSTAFALFVDRAREVDVGFGDIGEAEATAIVEICRRLDGIPLAIELAAARMVVMSPTEVRDRLDDRFRLLAGSRRGLERHQTLRNAVQWSYDLLRPDERALLQACSVFAGGFDLAGVVAVTNSTDDYAVLDGLDSLVRKSLVSADRHGRQTRYRLLETVRQFAEDQLADSGAIDDARARHAAFFADRSSASWQPWMSPQEREVYRWFEAELANLRAAFRYAADRGDLDVAATIAVPAACLGFYCLSQEGAGWCEELLPAAEQEHHRLLRSLYLGASLCCMAGRPADAIRYGEAGLALTGDASLEPFPYEPFAITGAMVGYLFTGRPDEHLRLNREMLATNADELAIGRVSEVWTLASMGRYDEAIALADDMLTAAAASPMPSIVAYGHSAYGKAYTLADPARALAAHRVAVQQCRDNDVRVFDAAFSRDLAALEATHGDPGVALTSFDQTLEVVHQAGDTANLTATLGYLVTCFATTGHTSEAATLAAAIAHRPEVTLVADFDVTSAQLRRTVDPATLDECERLGAPMTLGEATRYAREAIRSALAARGSSTR